MKWPKRTRYSVWQVSSKIAVCQMRGLSQREANRYHDHLARTLAMLRQIAPDGPRDMHALVLPDGMTPPPPPSAS